MSELGISKIKRGSRRNKLEFKVGKMQWWELQCLILKVNKGLTTLQDNKGWWIQGNFGGAVPSCHNSSPALLLMMMIGAFHVWYRKMLHEAVNSALCDFESFDPVTTLLCIVIEARIFSVKIHRNATSLLRNEFKTFSLQLLKFKTFFACSRFSSSTPYKWFFFIMH